MHIFNMLGEKTLGILIVISLQVTIIYQYWMRTPLSYFKNNSEKVMIIRKVISDRSIAVSYELTEFGSTALNILEDLRIWSEAHNIQLNK